MQLTSAWQLQMHQSSLRIVMNSSPQPLQNFCENGLQLKRQLRPRSLQKWQLHPQTMQKWQLRHQPLKKWQRQFAGQSKKRQLQMCLHIKDQENIAHACPRKSKPPQRWQLWLQTWQLWLQPWQLSAQTWQLWLQHACPPNPEPQRWQLRVHHACQLVAPIPQHRQKSQLRARHELMCLVAQSAASPVWCPVCVVVAVVPSLAASPVWLPHQEEVQPQMQNPWMPLHGRWTQKQQLPMQPSCVLMVMTAQLQQRDRQTKAALV